MRRYHLCVLVAATFMRVLVEEHKLCLCRELSPLGEGSLYGLPRLDLTKKEKMRLFGCSEAVVSNIV